MIQIYIGKIGVLSPRCLEDWILSTYEKRNKKLCNAKVMKANQIIHE